MDATRQTAGLGDSNAWTHHFTDANGIRLHYVAAGQGEPVILLHGFPEFWYSWRRQLPALAEAGFRPLTLDLRGYNQSSQPRGVRSYRTATLVEDLAGFIRQVSEGPAPVVGHDWGGALAWRLAALHPELVRKLAILNAPHPAAYRNLLKRSPRQWLRSAYVLFFQIPWLPQRLLRVGDFALMERAWRREPSNPVAFTDEDLAEYKRVFREPGALTGPINYYRAALRYSRDAFAEPQTVAAPTLVIWGCRDPYLDVRLIERLDRWVSDLRVERLAHASHWVQNDAHAEVNRLLIEFFTT